MIVSAYLPLNGFKHTIAIFGFSLSLEVKLSRSTLSVFEIGSRPTSFQLVLYELAYINVPSNEILSGPMQDAVISEVKQDTKFVEATQVKIDVIKALATVEDYHKYKVLAKQALDDTLLWYSKHIKQVTPSPYLKKLEAVFLSRLYYLGIKESGDYHWHLAMSEIHPEKESHLNSIYTNHEAVVQNGKN